MEKRVIVLGAGAAGLTAAIASAQGGVETVVLEKAPDLQNTNTARSGGAISIAMEWERDPKRPRLTVEEKVREAMDASDGRCDPALVRAWAENIDATVAWMKESGMKWGKPIGPGIPPELGVFALGGGAGLNKQLLSVAEKNGCKVLFNVRGEKLLTDSQGGVTGVRTRTPRGMEDFAAGSVVLATSGFQANQEMLLKYFGPKVGPRFAYEVRLTGSPFSTGDGHIMAQEVGAKLVGMDQCHGRNIDSSWVPGSPCLLGPYRVLQYPLVHYAIWLNKKGRRFMDEGICSDTAANAILVQPESEVAYLFDEGIKALRPRLVEEFRPPEVLIKANTLGEIAQRIGVPPDQLRNTVDEYNKAIDEGKADRLDAPKRAFTKKIENPPFYAVYPVWFGLNCTLGGPHINPQAQVQDRDDIPIPGLFAAGEMIGGFYSGKYYTTEGGASYYRGNYQVTCTALSMCVVFGRIAGISAARWCKGT